MASLYSPLRYPGGKNKTYSYIKHLVELNNITTYIEPFAGGAAVALRLLINNDVRRIIINDYDRSIYSFWYSVINYPDKLIEKITNTEITMDEWYKQQIVQENKKSAELLDLAFSTLFLNRTNRSGIIKAGVIGGKKQDGDYRMDCRFNKETIINRINQIATYTNKIEVCNYDAVEFIENKIKSTRKSLTFFDPPYYNKGPNLYTNFYKHEDHVELHRTIHKKMKNRFWILTYDVNDEIEKLYKKYEYNRYYLNYSISKPAQGLEYIFYSSKLNKGEVEKHLKLHS